MKLLLGVHVLELFKALLELFARRRILAYGRDHLHYVKTCLLVSIMEQLDNAVEHLQIVDFNFTSLKLSQ